MARPRGRRERVRNPTTAEWFSTLFLSVGLPLAMILSKPDEALREVFQIYGILGALSWFGLWLLRPEYLKFRGMSLLTMVLNTAIMFLAGGLASTIASAQSQGLIIVPLTLSAVTPLVEVTFVTAVLAFLVGWVEENLYGGLLYGFLLQPLGTFGKILNAAIFAWLHVPAYIPGSSPFAPSTWAGDPRRWLLLAPLITRFLQCYLIDKEGGIVGVALGHGLGDFLILLSRGG